jgi:hypothetical protein
MQACLKEQIGRNVKVYVDDIVIKSAKADSLLDDLRKTFANLDRYNIKLNLKKWSFGVPTGQLLGYLISERGIKGNSNNSKFCIPNINVISLFFYNLDLTNTDMLTKV